METSQAKRGRKTRDHTCSWDGKTVNGLHRIGTSNVWRIRATCREFTEVDERRAVARFMALQAPAARVAMPSVPVNPADPHAVRDLLAQLQRGGAHFEKDAAGQVSLVDDVAESSYISRVRADLEDRPEWLAKVTGFACLAWMDALKRPEKADSLEELGETYLKFNKLSDNELSRSKCFWAEFVKVARRQGATTVDGVNHDLAHAYEKYIEGQNLAPKSKLHRYRKIRGILHYAIKRGKSVEHCRKALDVLAMLEVKDAHPLDPTPITPADFWAIHAEALKAGDTTFGALLLLSLNAGLYGGEVAAVKWDELDFKTGGFVSRRSKTGVSRIAVLWPETIAAVKAVPHDRDEEVFCTRIRSYTVFSVGDKFEKYRDAAGVDKSVTFSWIRDAAYSTAMQATDFAKAELLAGHRLPGTADAYLRRNPQLVASACQAIAKAFDVAQHVKAAK